MGAHQTPPNSLESFSWPLRCFLARFGAIRSQMRLYGLHQPPKASQMIHLAGNSWFMRPEAVRDLCKQPPGCLHEARTAADLQVCELCEICANNQPPGCLHES